MSNSHYLFICKEYYFRNIYDFAVLKKLLVTVHYPNNDWPAVLFLLKEDVVG